MEKIDIIMAILILSRIGFVTNIVTPFVWWYFRFNF